MNPKLPTCAAAARSELEEMLRYERYVLRASTRAVQRARGVCGSTTILIPDDGPKEIRLNLVDTIGDTGARMTRWMSPLVFVSAYKLLDMVVEWTIRVNLGELRLGFAQKVKVIDSTPSLVYPDVIEADAALRAVLVGLFKEALPYRNAIIHGNWGDTVDGDLHFNFHKKDLLYQMRVRFDAILSLAESMSLLGDVLVSPTIDPSKVSTMKWRLDQLVELHRKPPFGISPPSYFQIVRKTRRPKSGQLVIDLSQVRSIVEQQVDLSSAVYDLTVEAVSATAVETWEIPFSDLPPGDSLELGSDWDAFLVSREVR